MTKKNDRFFRQQKSTFFFNPPNFFRIKKLLNFQDMKLFFLKNLSKPAPSLKMTKKTIVFGRQNT